MVIAKLHRQHTSVVMTVPKLICKSLGLCAGDYVCLQSSADSRFVFLSKFKPEDISNARNKRNPVGKNKGR